jgi:energy-coupling factor transport system permease protein
MRATVAGALDRSLDVAAVLEMRGYGRAGRARVGDGAFSRHDLAFAASAAAIVALAVCAQLVRVSSFGTYPLVHEGVTPGAAAIAVALVAIALAPFADRRGIAL